MAFVSRDTSRNFLDDVLFDQYSMIADSELDLILWLRFSVYLLIYLQNNSTFLGSPPNGAAKSSVASVVIAGIVAAQISDAGMSRTTALVKK
jgi:hypothetical protein